MRPPNSFSCSGTPILLVIGADSGFLLVKPAIRWGIVCSSRERAGCEDHPTAHSALTRYRVQAPSSGAR